MKCEEVHSNLGAFVLGGLEPEEAAEVGRHLAFCPDCQDELKELEEVTRALKTAPPHADPPSYLKEEILSRVRDEGLPLSSSSNEGPPPSRGSRFKRLRVILPGVASAALVAIVALGIFYGLQSKTPVATVQLMPTPALEEELRAEGENYWGVAQLYPQPSGNQQVELKLNNLEKPTPGSFYELWFVSGEKYISAGSFTSVGSGETDVLLIAPPEAQDYRDLLITEQSVDDDPAPSEEAILKGEVP